MKTRAELPSETSVVGEPAAQKAIDDYRAARQSFSIAVKEAFSAQKIAFLNDAIRAEAVRQIEAKFYPSGGWKIDLVDSVRRAAQSPLDESISITASRSQPLYLPAGSEDVARLMASSESFQAARKMADELEMPIASSWPVAPPLYIISKSRGEILKTSIQVRAHNTASEWVIDKATLNEKDIPQKNASDGSTVTEIGMQAAFLDYEQFGLTTPKDWQRRQDDTVAEVRAEERRFAAKYGSDRDAWHQLFKIFAAVGGRTRLAALPGISEQVRTEMPWPWLIGNREARGEGTIERIARPFRVDENLNVSFRFKPLLAAEYTVFFKSLCTTTQTSRRSVTQDCYALTKSGREGMTGSKEFTEPVKAKYFMTREYAAHLAWRLAADDGTFIVRGGDRPSRLFVKAQDRPEFQVDLDENGNIQKLSYTDSVAEKSSSQIVWQFGRYRTFDGLTLPTKREVFVDGKRDWSYEIVSARSLDSNALTNFTSAGHPQTPTERQIMTDLLGYTMRSGSEWWTFDGLHEFRRFTILVPPRFKAPHLSFRVQATLVSEGSRGVIAAFSIRYVLQNGLWVLDGIDHASFRPAD
ncbi:MAG: hypothetical protein HYV96_21190 [Opitutae bacterium]|nr:hypothetical protein [Opitutae bacterium]